MKLLEKNTAQKLRGGYYTPIEMTDFITEWAFSDNKKKTVLEPSCGDGAFLESLQHHIKHIKKCTAVELIEDEAEKARQKTSTYPNIDIINNDFFDEFENELKHNKYDLILGNPPYIRYQYLTPEQRETQSNILVNNGMKSNKLINAWVSFLVASVQMLSDNGKLAMVIPAELLQVGYAADLRLFLVDNLSKITIITFKELVFPDVQQEVVILLGEKLNSNKDNVISLVDLDNLSQLNMNEINEKIEFKEVDHSKDKWTKYFLSKKQLKVIEKITDDNKFAKFSEFASINVGITTGNNKYFSVTQDIVDKYDLKDITLPLIGRSAHAKGIYFDEIDWISNAKDGLKSQLLSFPDVPYEKLSKSQKSYVDLGEENDENKGYKCRIRRNWYHIPSVYSPDAFFLRRNDTFPKFVLNKIDAVSTDTMHRVRFNKNIDHKKMLLSYYNSITFAYTEIEGRSYGGGVLEVLPSEAGKILIPNIQDIDDEIVDSLLLLIDNTIRNNSDIMDILPVIDNEVLVKYLGIDKDIVESFRRIWKKLMMRRRTRK